MKTKTNLDALSPFVRAYLVTALWSSTDDAGNPLDADFSVADFSPDALARAVADSEAFQAANADTIAAAISEGVTCGPDFGPEGRAGHDFWLSRNGHGAGFFDGDWPEPYGDKLQDAARAFGELNPYVDENGQVSFD